MYWTEIHFTHVNVQRVLFINFRGVFSYKFLLKITWRKISVYNENGLSILYTYNFCHNRRSRANKNMIKPILFWLQFTVTQYTTYLKLEFLRGLLRRSKTSSRSICEAFYCTVSYSCNHKTVLISLIMFFVYLIMNLNSYIEVLLNLKLHRI